MIRELSGSTDGSGLKVGVVVTEWNRTVTDKLLAGALDKLDSLGVEDVTVLRVPGALELPIAAQALARGEVDAVVAIGTVVKGDTDHYDIVVRQSTSGISHVALEAGIPVANAILAVHDIADALERAGEGDANKGAEAAAAAVVTANALRQLRP